MRIGVLNDKEHNEPRRGARGLKGSDVVTTYAGGPVRKQSRKPSGKTNGEILVDNMRRSNTNFLSEPFEKKSSEILRFTTAFLKMAIARSNPKRVENLMQAIVRNPILRGEYGSNSAITKRIKGFDRFMIDTAQTFKSIRSKVYRV